jgi:hypothetical protein
MQSGRKFFMFLTTLLLLGALLAGAAPAWAQYVPGPKLTIVNNSGYPASQVYLVFLARTHYNLDGGAATGRYHHIIWHHDEFLPLFPPIAAVDNTKDINGILYAEYWTTLDKLSRDAGGNYYFFVPRAENDTVPADQQGIFSGRLWLAFQTPFYTHVTDAFTYSQPDYGNPTDPNYATVLDFYEVAIDPTTFKVTGDTTNVENVTMPLVHDLKNNGVRLPGSPMGLNLPLTKLHLAFGADPKFKKLVTPQRIYAPGHGIEKSLFPSDYYTNYVNKCWQLWTDNPLSIKVDGIWWSGKVGTDNRLKLSGTVSGETEDHYIAWPPSKDIFLCDGVFNGDETTWPPKDKPAPLARDKDIKNRIASSLNRTVMHLAPYADIEHLTAEPWAYPESYYQGVFLDPADYQTNVYAKILHELAINGSCYAYAYDDNDGKSTTISGQATDIILTINNCRPSITPVTSLLLLD